MKSWKNRRNTYWILLATIFGFIFPGNQINYYKNLIGLSLCWLLYIICYIYNNNEVYKQEQKEKQEYQKQVELESVKKEKARIKKEKEAQWFYELIECPKVINYIMAKYNRDWEKDLYPSDARYHINDIKRKIKSDIEFEEMKICNNKNAIERIKDFKKKTRSHYKCKELDRRIDTYQYEINRCQEHIKDIPKRYKQWINYYQNQIEQYKNQCQEQEQKANELLQNSPEEIIKAINCHLKKIEEVKQRPLKSRYDDKNKWVKREEEKLPYLLQAKLDAIDRIKKTEKKNEN